MSTAADIVLGGVAAVLAGGLVAMTVWLRAAFADRATANENLAEEKLRGDHLADARDAALVQLSQAKTLNDELTRRLAAADAQRNDAAVKEASDVADSISSAASASDALAALNQLRPAGASVPAGGKAAAPSAGDQHDSGSAGVPPANPPGVGPARS